MLDIDNETEENHKQKDAAVRESIEAVRRVEALFVDGLRRRGRPKLRWDDRLKQDMKDLLLSEDMTSDRNAWRDRINIGG
ncbi:hypothetical protein Tco_0547511 [Tanacetum coccineum]